jgi:hypothetical protein
MRLLTLLTPILLLVASGCKKNQPNDFPNVQVRELIYLNNPTNQALQNPGGWVYAPGGVKGLIIYRRYLNNQASDFAAYDRACPQHFNESCGLLNVSDDDIYALCSCNNEQYILFDGSPGKNAERGLYSYPVTFDGEVVVVSN